MDGKCTLGDEGNRSTSFMWHYPLSSLIYYVYVRGEEGEEKALAHNTYVSDVLKNRNISTEGAIWVEA